MMEIFLSINNREQVIQLPIVPSEFKVKFPYNNEVYETISQGEIKLIGTSGLKSISLSSFFPKKHYSFSRNRDYEGWEYISIIESWINMRVPIRIIIPNTNINLPMTIDDFEYGVQDGSGDIYYTLTLNEFKFIQLEQRSV